MVAWLALTAWPDVKRISLYYEPSNLRLAIIELSPCKRPNGCGSHNCDIRWKVLSFQNLVSSAFDITNNVLRYLKQRVSLRLWLLYCISWLPTLSIISHTVIDIAKIACICSETIVWKKRVVHESSWLSCISTNRRATNDLPREDASVVSGERDRSQHMSNLSLADLCPWNSRGWAPLSIVQPEGNDYIHTVYVQLYIY
jgi:hypothetical protein